MFLRDLQLPCGTYIPNSTTFLIEYTSRATNDRMKSHNFLLTQLRISRAMREQTSPESAHVCQQGALHSYTQLRTLNVDRGIMSDRRRRGMTDQLKPPGVVGIPKGIAEIPEPYTESRLHTSFLLTSLLAGWLSLLSKHFQSRLTRINNSSAIILFWSLNLSYIQSSGRRSVFVRRTFSKQRTNNK